MKKLFLIFALTFSFIGSSVYAEKIQGSYYCKVVYPEDGSKLEYAINIQSKTMSAKWMEYGTINNYKIIGEGDGLYNTFKVFLQVDSSNYHIIVLTETDGFPERLHFNGLSTGFRKKVGDRTQQGTCSKL